jgi:hypothetical protein
MASTQPGPAQQQWVATLGSLQGNTMVMPWARGHMGHMEAQVTDSLPLFLG